MVFINWCEPCDLVGDNDMENIVLIDEKPLWAWTLFLYQASLQDTQIKPYMYGSNNMYRLGEYNNVLNAKEVKK
jgi:hypothetical protein